MNRRRPRSSGDRATRPAPVDARETLLDGEGQSLLDVIDNALNKGIVLTGDLTIGLAHVDLIYARLSLLLCAADRMLPVGVRGPVAPRAPAPAGRVRPPSVTLRPAPDVPPHPRRAAPPAGRVPVSRPSAGPPRRAPARPPRRRGA